MFLSVVALLSWPPSTGGRQIENHLFLGSKVTKRENQWKNGSTFLTIIKLTRYFVHWVSETESRERYGNEWNSVINKKANSVFSSIRWQMTNTAVSRCHSRMFILSVTWCKVDRFDGLTNTEVTPWQPPSTEQTKPVYLPLGKQWENVCLLFIYGVNNYDYSDL